MIIVKKQKVGWRHQSNTKVETHVRIVERIKEILPISKVIIEVANFDIQKIKSPEMSGKEYQQGSQTGYWNLREYILYRDGHKCQNAVCKNRAEEKILQVHHVGYWKQDRTDRPSNLITLCTKCHTAKNHQKGGFLYGWQPKLKPFKAESFMSTVRWRLLNILQATASYGYQTKTARIALGLAKSHHNDAFVIAGGREQSRAAARMMSQIRRNKRSLQKFYDAKYRDQRTGEKESGCNLNSGRRTRNKELSGENLRVYRGGKLSKGRVSVRRQRYQYQPQDKVKYQDETYVVKGMQNYGAYIKLAGLAKPVKTILVTSMRWRKGICEA